MPIKNNPCSDSRYQRPAGCRPQRGTLSLRLEDESTRCRIAKGETCQRPIQLKLSGIRLSILQRLLHPGPSVLANGERNVTINLGRICPGHFSRQGGAAKALAGPLIGSDSLCRDIFILEGGLFDFKKNFWPRFRPLGCKEVL